MSNPSIDTFTDRTTRLRFATFYSFFLSFFLFLIHGVTSGSVFPALGFVVLACSTVQAASVLHRDSIDSLGSAARGLKSRTIFYMDLVLATLYALCLFASWVSLSDGHDRGHGARSRVILGTYCTAFMLVNW